jgi:hypothetical protein
VRPHDADYALLRSSYMRVGAPALVIRATSEEHVVEALQYAALVREAQGDVAFSIRSGGHGIAGTSTNDAGIVLDVRQLASIHVDTDTRLVTIGAGATWGEVAGELSPHGLVISSGNFGDTGVGGLATSGGIGYFARSQGLTIDAVRRVRLVTPDGRIRWVDDTHEPELFWAVRGGGAHVGVAVAFVIEATSLGEPGALIIHQNVQYFIDDVPGFTAAWGQWVDAAPRELESFLMIQREQGGVLVNARNVWAGSEASAAEPVLAAALDLGQAVGQTAQIVPYAHIVPSPGQPHIGQQRIHMRDVLVDRADAATGRAIEAALADELTLLAELRALGGAVSDVPADATAWAGRSQKALAATWTAPAEVERVDQSFAPLQAIGTGMYGAYSSDIRPSAAALSWPGATGERLRVLAQQTDPSGLLMSGRSLSVR